MAQYETALTIDRFKGINQSLTLGDSLPLQYAVYAENADCSGGNLKPMRRGEVLFDDTLPAPIETLARLYRRSYAIEDKRNVLVAVAGGKLYTRANGEWSWTERFSGIQNNDFDYVSYETNLSLTSDTVDILLLSNQDDGMLCLYGNDLSVKKISTPHKFGVIGRHAERIWGAGVKNYPDTLTYSAPFNPFDWEQNNEHPEDGAGDIRQPSWDGDKFIALRSFGSQLLAFKNNRVWRILGTHPGNYVFKEQYGGGALIENTVVVVDTMVFMLSFGGIMAYDGVSVSPFKQEEIQDIWSRINKSALHKACATHFDEKLYFSVPLDDSECNNAVIIYDFVNRSFMLRTDTYISSFLEFDWELLYASCGKQKGKVWRLNGGEALPMVWRSGWQDLGAKNVVKSGFEVYLSIDAPENMAMDIKIETEKKPKTKTYTAKTHRVKRVRVANNGRRFMLELKTDTNLLWYLRAGLQVQVELDAD